MSVNVLQVEAASASLAVQIQTILTDSASNGLLNRVFFDAVSTIHLSFVPMVSIMYMYIVSK